MLVREIQSRRTGNNGVRENQELIYTNINGNSPRRNYALPPFLLTSTLKPRVKVSVTIHCSFISHLSCFLFRPLLSFFYHLPRLLVHSSVPTFISFLPPDFPRSFLVRSFLRLFFLFPVFFLRPFFISFWLCVFISLCLHFFLVLRSSHSLVLASSRDEISESESWRLAMIYNERTAITWFWLAVMAVMRREMRQLASCSCLRPMGRWFLFSNAWWHSLGPLGLLRMWRFLYIIL